ncbi:MAG: hypothetical protein FWH36_00840 [Lentimicrobiaceae bacterium]|nr:hypothetical protein [Lentimicrobiaceae bacterium]
MEVSNKKFVSYQKGHFDRIVKEDASIRNGENLFVFARTINDSENDYLNPDEDFYRAITMEEFKIKAREVVEKAYNRYTNERNHITRSSSIFR